MVHASLHRYSSILDHADALWAVLERPLPHSVWVNPLKTETTSLEEVFRGMEWDWSTVPWHPGGYSLRGVRPGQSLAFNCGWYTVQEEIAWSAVRAIDPQPGDRVLDLCAAPGGKTAQLSLAVGPKGAVMANERSLSRLSSLVTTITRLGLTNVVTSQVDGCVFPAQPHSFDRVLVDAPCSGEGTLRKKVGRRSLDQENWNERHSHRLAETQKRLLNRALDLVKPGGVVVYSTCTFAPEENEAVLDAVVGDRGLIEPYVIPGLQACPGVSQWQGHVFRPDSQYAQRYWPHLNDTGGFFVARIRRSESNLVASTTLTLPPTVANKSSLQRLSQEEGEKALAWLGERFGMAHRIFQPYDLWCTGREKIWIADHACLALTANVSAPLETIGIPLIRRTPHSFKPTTAGLQRFGPHVRHQAIDLDVGQCRQFMAGHAQPFEYQPFKSNLLDTVPLDTVSLGNLEIGRLEMGSLEMGSLEMGSQQSSNSPRHGFIHLRCGPYELGCGRLKQGVLYSEIPKALRCS